MFNPTSDLLPAAAVAQINPCNILHSFSKFGRLTIFLNRLFNNYGVYTLDKEYFFLFLKDMINKKHIQRHDLTFFKHHKEDKVIKMVHDRFPHLKRMEVLMLIDLVKEDEEVYPKFAEMVGLQVPKKKKLTKKDKAAIAKSSSETPTEPKIKKPKVEKTKPVVESASFDAWKQGFKTEEN